MPNDRITLFFSKLQQSMADLPTIIGNEAVNYTLDAFEAQAWESVPWEARKSKKDDGRALLVKSGMLKRSVRIISQGASSVTIGTDVIYARIHNDGGEISRGARSETFVRPRYERGKKGTMFGGMGAFRKMTRAEKVSAPVKGQSYKAYSYRMPRRQFIGNTPELRERVHQAVIAELRLKLKG
jgi:phage gpG-like protein